MTFILRTYFKCKYGMCLRKTVDTILKYEKFLIFIGKLTYCVDLENRMNWLKGNTMCIFHIDFGKHSWIFRKYFLSF